MRINLRTVFPLGLAAVAVVLIGFHLLLEARYQDEQHVRQLEERSRTLGTLLASQLETSYARGGASTAQNFLSHACGDRALAGADLLHPEGRIVLSSTFRREGGPLPSELREFERRLGARVAATQGGATLVLGKRLVGVYPVQLESDLHGPTALLFLEWDLARGREASRAFLWHQVVVSCLVIGLAGLLAFWLFDRFWLSRVEQLVDVGERIGSGAARAEELELGGSDELAEIAAAMRRMLSEVEAGRARLSALVANVSELILVLEGPLERIDFASPSAATFLGREPAELVGADLATVLERVETDLFAPRDGSGRLLEASWGGTLGEGRRVVVLRDVTEARRLKTKLDQARDLELAGRLTNDVAHDFNNLLSVIIGYAGMVNEDAGAGLLKIAGEKIEHAAEVGAALCNGLLTLSRRGEVDLRPQLLDEEVSNAIPLLKTLLSSAVSLQVELESEVSVASDMRLLTQILLNLGSNARDAMGEDGDGSLVIRTERVPDEECSKRGLEGPWARLIVLDNGPGIELSQRDRVFEAFQSTKGVGGTGLGLAIVREASESLGAEVFLATACEGEPPVPGLSGSGTRVEIWLPVLERPAVAPPPARQAPHGLRALLVEDEPSVRQLVQAQLEQSGYQVTACADAEAGIQALDVAPVDLILTDHNLPGMSGEDLIHKVRETDPSTLVVLISGSLRSEKEWGLAGPRTRFLGKPYTFDQLRAVLQGAA